MRFSFPRLSLAAAMIGVGMAGIFELIDQPAMIGMLLALWFVAWRRCASCSVRNA